MTMLRPPYYLEPNRAVRGRRGKDFKQARRDLPDARTASLKISAATRRARMLRPEELIVAKGHTAR